MVGRQKQKLSVQLSRQLSKEQALNLLQPYAIFYVTLTLKTFVWLDGLLSGFADMNINSIHETGPRDEGTVLYYLGLRST